MSSWRHMTPLGMPVVPPVQSPYRSSGERSPTSGVGVGTIGEQVLVALVGDHDRARPGERCGGPRRAVLEVGLGEHNFQIGVVEQVRQLLVDVAEVHVHRHRAELVRRQRGLDVLVAVVEMTADVIALADSQREPARARAG